MATRNLNKAMIIGYLGRDPEMKYLPSGQAVANFTVATSENWKGKDGGDQEKTEWHKVVAFGKLGEICGEYISKGSQVYIEGRIQTRSWDQDGTKRYMTEIIAREVLFLSNAGMQGTSGGGDEYIDNSGTRHDAQSGSAPDDDIPFNHGANEV